MIGLILLCLLILNICVNEMVSFARGEKPLPISPDNRLGQVSDAIGQKVRMVMIHLQSLLAVQ